jgi:acyl carrier protein
MTEAQIYDTLSNIFKDVFARNDIVLRAETSAKDVDGWDSLKQIEILVAVQERCKVKLRTKEIDSLKTVGDLAGLIAQKLAVA